MNIEPRVPLETQNVRHTVNDFVKKTSEHFNLSFEDALAAVSQSKVANDVVASGVPEDNTSEELFKELLDEISKGI